MSVVLAQTFIDAAKGKLLFTGVVHPESSSEVPATGPPTEVNESSDVALRSLPDGTPSLSQPLSSRDATTTSGNDPVATEHHIAETSVGVSDTIITEDKKEQWRIQMRAKTLQ